MGQLMDLLLAEFQLESYIFIMNRKHTKFRVTSYNRPM